MLHSRGFTLIELLLTVSIIVLLTGVLVPNFGPFKQRQTVERAALELRSKILEAQSYALAPRRLDTNLTGYSFVFTRTPARWGLAKLPNPRTTIASLSDPNIIETVDLPAPIAIDFTSFNPNSTGVYEVDFLSGGRAKAENITSSGTTSSGVIELRLTGSGQSKSIKIFLDSGVVTVE